MGHHLLQASAFEAQHANNNEQMLVQDTLASRDDLNVQPDRVKAGNQEKRERDQVGAAPKSPGHQEKTKTLAFPEIGRTETDEPESKPKEGGSSPGAPEDAKQLKIKKEESVEIPQEAEEMNMIEIAELFKQKAGLLEE